VPEYPPALVGRARVALGRRQARQAIELLDKAYRVNPLPETAWLLGDARAMAGDRDGARREYDRVVRDGHRSDRLTLALFYATKNHGLDDAVRLIEAERRVRGGVYVDDVYAWVLFRAGRVAEARDVSERALRLGTPDARLLYHAGAIRLAAGDRQGLELVRRALALNPRFDTTGAAEAARLASGRADGN
jgi:tetratricopeptide (TPR) repeat protein